MRYILLLIAYLYPLNLFAESPWIGEWGQWQDEDNGANFSIKGCTEKSCSFEFKSGQPESKARCQGRGWFEYGAESEGKGHLQTYDNRPDNCNIHIIKKERELSIKLEGAACKNYCTTEGKFEEKYNKRSEKNYYNISFSEICYFDNRESVKLLCTDESVNKAWNDWKKKREEFFSFSKSMTYSEQDAEYKKLQSEELARCEKEANIKDCLIKGFEEKYSKLNSEVENLSSQRKLYESRLAAPGDVSEAKKLISKYQGVYKHKFKNGLVGGEEYESEDVFEIADFKDNAFYFRAHTYFFNGHECEIWGMAEYRGSGEFLYQSEADDQGRCELIFSLNEKEVGFDIYSSPLSDEDRTCSLYCGARGSLNNVRFPYAAKRTIKYLDKLKKSEEFASAAKEFEKEKL